MSTLLGCPIDEDLATQAQALVDKIRAADGEIGDTGQITAVISRLTEASLDYYFTRPVRELGGGRTVTGIVTMGNRGAVQVIRRGLKQVMNRFNREQILRVADYLEDSFYET